MFQPHISDFKCSNITSVFQIPLSIWNIPSFKEDGIDTLKTPLKEHGDTAARIEPLRFKLCHTLQQQKARRLLLTLENWPSSFVDLGSVGIYIAIGALEDIHDNDDHFCTGIRINQRHTDLETTETAERSTKRAMICLFNRQSQFQKFVDKNTQCMEK